MHPQLRQDMLMDFMKKKESLLHHRQKFELIKNKGLSPRMVFMSRYDQHFIMNVADPEVFKKTLDELEKLLCIERGVNVKTKTKALKDEIFIDTFLELLFTEDEKAVINQGMSYGFDLAPLESEIMEEEQAGERIEPLSHMLKYLFEIRQGPERERPEYMPFPLENDEQFDW